MITLKKKTEALAKAFYLIGLLIEVVFLEILYLGIRTKRALFGISA